jgi:quercetin dioxygenase-like cupin family protein
MNAAPPDERAWVRPLDAAALRPVAHIRGRYARAVQPEAANLGMIVGMAEMESGQDTGWDVHPEPEAFFVLSGQGEGRWEIDGREEVAPLLPGAVFYKIGGVRHRMVNTCDRPLTGVFFKIRPAAPAG